MSRPTTGKPQRRGLLGTLAALGVGVPTLSLSLTIGPADDEMIQACETFIATRAAYNAYAGPWGPEDQHPLDDAMADAETRLEALEPVTMAGVAALARVALDEGQDPNSHFCHCVAGPRLEQVARALVRLMEGAA